MGFAVLDLPAPPVTPRKERERRALEAEGKATGHLEAYTRHRDRHTFASRLVTAGVDLRTVQQLGGWQSLAMVQRRPR